MKELNLHNEARSSQLRKLGYVIIDQLDLVLVEKLKDLFFEHHPTLPSGFYASTHVSDLNFRKKMSALILGLVEQKISSNFKNLNILGSAFISKAPGPNSILPLHQDWNIVDETVARSYNIWIPLIDVNETNGAMTILAESHKKQPTYRGANIKSVMSKIEQEVLPHMTSLNMKAGEILVYDHALWHASPPNNSDQIRLALVLGVVPSGVEMKCYHQDGSVINIYDSHSAYFFENNPSEGPRGLDKCGEIVELPAQLSKDQFSSLYLGKESLWEKFKSRFTKKD